MPRKIYSRVRLAHETYRAKFFLHVKGMIGCLLYIVGKIKGPEWGKLTPLPTY
jgi:hypothetical protein